MSEQPGDVLDFQPISMTRCDACIQMSIARLDTAKGPLFFCNHHVKRFLPETTVYPNLTYATVIEAAI